MADPFTIRIFVPDGDPEGLRIIDRMNWTGLGIIFPRKDWQKIRQRADFSKPGVYILIGYIADDDLPTLYIGQGDVLRARLDSHVQTKDFWSKAIVFVSSASSGGLNRAHATWLEHSLIHRAIAADRSHLENGTEPQEPQLSEAEKADTQAFLREMIQILPLVGLNAFDAPKAVAEPMTKSVDTAAPKKSADQPDTIVVPAQKDGFDRVFIGENAWWAIRISGGMLPKIKYIAAYQSQPVSAVTHVAPVARIEPHGDSGKYKLIFSEPAKPIKPIPFADAPSGFMQGTRYTTFTKLQTAKKVTDLFEKPAS
ncbi:MAG: GIY-YIG nuclease family protein [Xanthobacteraceae bacterium]